MKTDVMHQHHPAVGYGFYVKIWAALLVLTACTVGISYVNLRNITVVAALIIATTKAGLVATYFMHLGFDKPLYRYMLVAAFIFLGISLGLIFVDYSYR